ncbi:hypothetical protein ThvES_00010960 [Thiovulum sp. ES]|nr:hypothetical protein ThvES_00010960 [Thiovulum sp. ES]
MDKNSRGGYRQNSGRKQKGKELGLSGESVKFSVNMPIEIENWIISQDGKNRNDKLIKVLFECMKKGLFIKTNRL